MIDFDRFLDWAESRFDGDVRVAGSEIKINTIFPTPSGNADRDHTLWCNPYGGKYGRPNGVFHCWKSEKTGSLISLVMMVDKCTYEQAVEVLGCDFCDLKELENELNAIWKIKPQEEEEEEKSTTLELPPGTYFIEELPSTSYYRVQAEVYLFNRKLPTEGLMVCTLGKFRNRIIIPYYDAEKKLIYFNGRFIGDSDKVPKYRGPNKEVGIGKDDVLYVPEWPAPENKLYLTEGEFDALSIYISGKERKRKIYSGAFGGKNLSDKQVEMIRPYKAVLCLDTDKAGSGGMVNMTKRLWSRGIMTYFVRPPQRYKDWNKMLETLGSGILLHYIDENEKVLDNVYLANLMLK